MQLVVVAIAIAIATDSALSLCMHCFCPAVELSFVAGWLAGWLTLLQVFVVGITYILTL